MLKYIEVNNDFCLMEILEIKMCSTASKVSTIFVGDTYKKQTY